MRFVLQGAVSGCRGWWASLWPKSSSSQVVLQKCWHVAIDAGGLSFSEGCGSHSLAVCPLSGRRVGGQTALEMGLVNRAVEQNQTGDAAYREALRLAREILPQVRIQTHFFTLLQLRHRCIPPPPGQGRTLPPCFSSAFLSASFNSAFLSLFLVFSPPSLPSLQASVAPYFFHSSSDARSWQGQSGSQVEKWTTNSTTHTHTH